MVNIQALNGYMLGAAGPTVRVREVGVDACWRWIREGWTDSLRSAVLSWYLGLALALFSSFLILVGYNKFWLLAGVLVAFLALAPVYATSFYAMSRALERGEPVRLGLLRQTWTRWQSKRDSDHGAYWSLVRFGLLLALAALGLVLVSAAIITLFSPVPVRSPTDFMQYVVLAKDGWLFELWLAAAVLMAAPIYASSVVTMPLLLDREIGVWRAVMVSWQALLANPIPLALWAVLLLGLSFAGLLVFVVGIGFVLPILGHASWHAYRELLDVSALEER